MRVSAEKGKGNELSHEYHASYTAWLFNPLSTLCYYIYMTPPSPEKDLLFTLPLPSPLSFNFLLGFVHRRL